MGFFINLVLMAVSLYIAYLVITVAVRHGIDSSEVGRMLKEKNGFKERKFQPKDDLDKDN